MDPGLVALAVAGAVTAAALAPRRHASAVRYALVAQAAALTLTETMLARATLTNDGRYAEVADTASRATPTLYRIAGLWGGSRSSLLTFTWLLALVGALVLLRGHRPVGAARRLLVVAGALSVLTVVFADPFARLAIPAIDGGGLTPILSRPAMLIHPPLLYLGLVLAIIAACEVAGDVVIKPTNAPGSPGPAVPGSARCAWGVLVVALALGSWWAHAELGWGGVWGWDPVENAGLVPWLLLGAAVHAGRTRPTAARALVAAAGWTAIAGTTLTRAGAAQSVHAFASSVRLGRALAVLLAVGVVALWRDLRRRSAPSAPRPTTPVAQLGAITLTVAAVIVAVGTAAPLVAVATGHAPFAVKPSFFVSLLGPLAALALAGQLLVDGPVRRADAVALGAGGLAGLGWFALWRSVPAALVLVVMVVTLGRAVATQGHRSTWPRTLAHGGFALMIAGVAVNATGASATGGLSPGGPALAVHGSVLRLEGVTATADSERTRTVAVIAMRRGGSSVTMRPSLDRWHDVAVPLAETATVSRWGVDTQIVLRRVVPGADGLDRSVSVVVDVHVLPLVRFVWWGAAVMGIGAFATLASPSRRKRRAPDEGRAFYEALPPLPPPMPSLPPPPTRARFSASSRSSVLAAFAGPTTELAAAATVVGGDDATVAESGSVNALAARGTPGASGDRGG